jgi:hypothetical protein
MNTDAIHTINKSLFSKISMPAAISTPKVEQIEEAQPSPVTITLKSNPLFPAIPKHNRR